MFSYGAQLIAYKMWVRMVLNPMSTLMVTGLQVFDVIDAIEHCKYQPFNTFDIEAQGCMHTTDPHVLRIVTAVA